MDKQLEERIRERAYELWMQHGCLPGRDEEYWYQAEQEILDATGAQPIHDGAGETASDVGYVPLMEGEGPPSGDESSAPADISPTPLGMTSQTTDELLPSADESQAAPAAAKARKRRSTSSAASGEGPDGTGEAPKRRRTVRTP